MKIFYFRKNAIVWGIILIIAIIALLILLRVANGGTEPSENTLMIAANWAK